MRSMSKSAKINPAYTVTLVLLIKLVKSILRVVMIESMLKFL